MHFLICSLKKNLIVCSIASVIVTSPLSAQPLTHDKQNVPPTRFSDLWRYAQESDKQWLQQRKEFEAIRQQEKIDRSNLGTTLALNADASRVYADVETETDVESTNYTDKTYAVQLEQPLYNAPAWHRVKATKANIEASRFDLNDQRQLLAQRLVQALVGLLNARSEVTFARAEEKAIERQFNQTEQRFEVGLVAKTDVLDAEAAQDLAKVRVLDAENALQQAREELRIITSVNAMPEFDLKSNLTLLDFNQKQESQWVEKSLNENLQLEAQEARLEAFEHLIVAQRREWMPTVDAFALYSDSDTSRVVGSSFAGESRSVGVGLTWIPFQGGRLKATYQQIQLQRDATLAQQALLQERVTTDSRNLVRDLQTGEQRIASRATAITSARSALEATEEGYRLGTRNVVDVLNAQQILFRTQSDYANSRYQYVQDLVSLYAITGELTDQQLNELDAWFEPAEDTL
ncbi:MAG: TolC family protein [Pseudomonadota bacterium]